LFSIIKNGIRLPHAGMGRRGRGDLGTGAVRPPPAEAHPNEIELMEEVNHLE